MIRKRQGWEQISAVKNNRVHAIQDEILNTPSPIPLEGLDVLAALIHPER